MLTWDHSGHQETFNTWVKHTDTTQSVVEEIYDTSLETKVTVFPIGASVIPFESVILKSISTFLSTNSL